MADSGRQGPTGSDRIRNASVAQPLRETGTSGSIMTSGCVVKIRLAICSEERLLVTAEEAEGEIDRQTAEHEQD